MFTSLRARLIVSYIVIILICLVLVSLASIFLLSRFQAKLVISGLADAAVPTALRVYSLLERDLSPAEIVDLLKEQAEKQEVRILLLTPRGQVLADTQGDWTGKQAKVDLAEIPKDTRTPYPYVYGRVTPPNSETQLYVALSVTPSRLAAEDNEESQRRVFVALLASPRRGLRTVLKDVASRFLQAGLVTLVISIVLALLIARSIARPLQRMTAATEEIARGNYDQTLDITSPDEVGRLAASFNTMTHEVKASRQAQRDFVANVSHELKTPLTSIQGFSQAILDGTADDEVNRHRAVEIISNETNRMSRLVDELLDLARIESGQIKMLREPVDLTKILESCVEKFDLQAKEGNVALVLDAPGLPLVTGDKDRLAQVFTNLLANALKHTPAEGKVTVRAQEIEKTRVGRATQSSAVEITVTDTGMGIPPADLEHIFERFYQVDKSRAGKDRGVGLGLTIAKQIIELHEGTIKVESVRDLGTKFTVALPIQKESYQPI
jgi:two-component system OmpR family sensor kinase